MQSRNQKVRAIYGYCLAGLVSISAICLIVACVLVYFANPQDPFSKQTVTNAFSYVAIPIYFTLFCVVGGAVIHVVFPVDERKTRARKNDGAILSRLYERADVESLSLEDRGALSSLGKRRRILHYVNTAAYVLFGLTAFSMAVYILSSEVFGEKTNAVVENDVTATVISCTLIILACAVVPFGINVFRILAEPKWMAGEIEILRRAEKLPCAKSEKSENEKRERTIRYSVMGSLFVIAIVCFIVSFGDGSYLIWENAQKICSSCIGLG